MTEITVDVCGPTRVKRTLKGLLVRSAVHRRRRKASFTSALSSSLFSASTRSALVGHVAGIIFSLLIGCTLLFVQKIPVWPCAYITMGVGFVSAFGMGLSQTIRVDVALMMPSLCSGHGRNLIFMIFVSVLISGPLSNSLHNIQLTASTVVCSAELTANQTQELLRRAASPLSSVLDNLREITGNAYETVGRIKHLIDALTDTVRHIARTLRNLLHFLVDIGDICNEEMGAPHRKCRKLFEEARTDCNKLLGDFNFLCEIVDGFLPLCDLAKAGELFCVIPSYVAEQLKKRLATPVVAAFDQLKQEFVFDLDANVTFDLEVNSSQSWQEMAQKILEEVTSDLWLLEMLRQPLKYTAVLMLLWTYYKGAHYQRRYLRDLNFDDVYITADFRDLDRRVTSRGGVSVLPITAQESRVYTSPLSRRLSHREKRAVLAGMSSDLKHFLIGGIVVLVDYFIFWTVDLVWHQVTEDIVVRAPVQVRVSVNGSGFAANIYRDLVHSFQILQSHNLTIFSQECIVQPREPDVGTSIILGFLLGLSLLLSVCAGFVQRTKRVICSWFHPQREQERLLYLRRKILEERQWDKRALRAIFRTSPLRSRGQARLQALLLRIPGVPKLCQVLGLRNISCISCAKDVESELAMGGDSPDCSAVYCRECVLRWSRSCIGCSRPLTSQDDLYDFELGSIDDDEEVESDLNQHQTGPIQTEASQNEEGEEEDDEGFWDVMSDADRDSNH